MPAVPGRERAARRSRLRSKLVLLLCLAGLASLALAAQASADVYWTNTGGGTIEHADPEFKVTEGAFISGLDEPFAIAVSSEYIYWSTIGNNSIGRAKLDGTEVEPNFITGVEDVFGIAVGGGHIFFTSEGTESIDRANLDGSEVIELTPAGEPRSIAYEDGYVYWTEEEEITRIAADGTEYERPWVEIPSLSHGLAAYDGYLYVAEDQEDMIDRVDIATATLQKGFITGLEAPVATAADADGIYWGSGFRGNGSLGSAKLDGSEVNNEAFFDGFEYNGVAVTPSPETGSAPETTPGGTTTTTPSTTTGPVATLTTPAATASPLRLIKVARNRQVGVGRLRVHAPGAGTVTISGPGVRTARHKFSAAGNAYIKVHPKGSYLARLLSHHRGFTKVRIAFQGSGATTKTVTRRIRLVMR